GDDAVGFDRPPRDPEDAVVELDLTGRACVLSVHRFAPSPIVRCSSHHSHQRRARPALTRAHPPGSRARVGGGPAPTSAAAVRPPLLAAGALRPFRDPLHPCGRVTTTMRAMRYPPADLADVDDDILALARRPAEFRAFFAYYDALMEKESGNLTKADREMIVVATSAINRCLYCVVAHGAMLRIFQKDPYIADVVATNYRQADISAR